MKSVSKDTQQIWHKHQSKNPYHLLDIPPFHPKTQGQNEHSHLLDLFDLNCIYLKVDGHENRHEKPKCRKEGGIKEFGNANGEIISSIAQIQPQPLLPNSLLEPSTFEWHNDILIPMPTQSIPDLHPPPQLNEWARHPTISYPLPWPDECASGPTISSPPPAALSCPPLWLNKPHGHHHLDPIVHLPCSHPPSWPIQANTSPIATSHPAPWQDECASGPITSSTSPLPPTTISYPPPWPDEHTSCPIMPPLSTTTSHPLPWPNDCASDPPTSVFPCHPHYQHDHCALHPHPLPWPN